MYSESKSCYSSPLKRTRIRPVSTKRAKLNREYTKLRQKYLTENPVCEKCAQSDATDIHHKAGRSGNWLVRVDYFAALCRSCHDFCHANPKSSREDGWIIDVYNLIHPSLDREDP